MHLEKVPHPPKEWVQLNTCRPPLYTNAFTAWEHERTYLTVLRSLSQVKDGGHWIHVSVARPDRMPSWMEMAKVRDEFLGPTVEAYHVCPRAEDYVNVHQYCLHLWAPVDGVRRVANLQDLIAERGI